jgi:hypothetical protein
MKNNLTPEEKAEHALTSLDGILLQDPPAGFRDKMFARMDREFFNQKVPKWFWAAAAVLLLVNISIAWKFSGSSTEATPKNTLASYYFRGGTDWYNQ